MFWKSVPFFSLSILFFSRAKIHGSLFFLPPNKGIFMRERKKPTDVAFSSFPVLLWEKGGGGIFQKAPFGNLLLAEGEKSLLGASSGAIEKFHLCWFFAWKIWENGDTIFSPFFPRDDVYTIETDVAAEKKTSFSHAKRAKVDDPQFPSQPQIQKKNVLRISKDKSQCVLCPRLNRTDPAPKKKIAVHTSCSAHPSFPLFRQRKL